MDSFPSVEDHLVEAEVTRDEIIGGRRVVAMPAHAPHATQHTRLDYVLDAHVVPGYEAATGSVFRSVFIHLRVRRSRMRNSQGEGGGMARTGPQVARGR